MRVPLTAVGRDYVACDDPLDLLVPLSRAVVLTAGSGSAPDLRDDSLSIVVRGWRRRGLRVRVHTCSGAFCGRLVAAGVDHLCLQDERGRVAVAFGSIELVRAAPGGSGDVP